MSIIINKQKCVGCNKCAEVCPGNLIKISDNKAFIKYEEQCWGCAACLKECSVGAISYFLHEDIGGKGGYMYTRKKGLLTKWHIVKKNGEEVIIETNGNESNKY